jgi:hypothetical protein
MRAEIRHSRTGQVLASGVVNPNGSVTWEHSSFANREWSPSHFDVCGGATCSDEGYIDDLRAYQRGMTMTELVELP